MEKEIHGQDRDKGGKEWSGEGEEHPGDEPHDTAKEDESYDSSLYELLDVPTLRDIVVFGMFDFASIDGILGEFYDIAIGRSGSPESLSYGVLLKSFESRHGTIEVPLGGARAEDDLVDGSLVFKVKESGEYGEKEHNKETFFLIFPPDGSEGKYCERDTSEDDSYEGTSWISEKYESKQDDGPDSDEEMVCFFGSEIVDEESQIDDDEIGCRVGSIKYSLESFDSGTIYAVIDRRSSSEAPVTEISGESEVEEDGFMEYEPHENPRNKGGTCRK